MKHLGSILLAGAFLMAGATACFKDPTSSLRNGPYRIELSRSVIYLATGDSLDVEATVKDQQGYVYDASGATWTSADEAVAVVRADTLIIPGGAFARAFVRAVATVVDTTTVSVTAQGLTATFRVYTHP